MVHASCPGLCFGACAGVDEIGTGEWSSSLLLTGRQQPKAHSGSGRLKYVTENTTQSTKALRAHPFRLARMGAGLYRFSAMQRSILRLSAAVAWPLGRSAVESPCQREPWRRAKTESPAKA
jgi:hypothetical protein